jgi:hypothetical protein
LSWLPTHLTIQAIADRLGCKRSTAKTHVEHIYDKLGATTRGEAVVRARAVGLIETSAGRSDHATGPMKGEPRARTVPRTVEEAAQVKPHLQSTDGGASYRAPDQGEAPQTVPPLIHVPAPRKGPAVIREHVSPPEELG